MTLKSLYRDYFQKSRVFLYPTLKIPRGSSVTPIETYIAWEGFYTPEDKMLICLYYLRNDPEFRAFEKSKLLGNDLFHDFKQIDDFTAAYIFTFKDFEKDWDNFLIGKYSLFTKNLKVNICDFYSKSSANYGYIESFLYPKRFFGIYSELLGVTETVLEETGELCSLPDMEKEVAILKINLDIKKIIS